MPCGTSDPVKTEAKQERRHAVRVRVNDAEREYLAAEAARTDRSVSAVLRLALKEYYERREGA